jgi:hypothetical protein
MNSVIVHFVDTEKSRVDSYVSKLGVKNGTYTNSDGRNFYWWDYNDYLSEYGHVEKDRLEQILFGQPSCSFQLAVRYENARLASEFLLKVMRQFPKSVFDDDMGGLWNDENLKAHLASSTNATFYTLTMVWNL